MASELSQRCPGTVWPDYTGGSLVNLMASLGAALGAGPSPYAPLKGAGLPVGLGQRRSVALIVIDGLGEAPLEHLGPDSALAAAQRDRLTSVFPSTTAAAVTTLMTGAAPGQHALTGWYVRLEDSDEIVAPLPLYVRHPAGSPSSRSALAGRLFGQPAFAARINRPTVVLQPSYIADSEYSRAHAGPATRLGYDTPEDAFLRLESLLQEEGPARFIYAYLPELDSLMHDHGVRGEPVADLFHVIDRAFARLAGVAAQQDAVLLVTADHGFIDAPEARQIDLEHHPDLAACLALPLSGERRVAFCHVRPEALDTFDHLAENELGHAAWCLEPGWLLEAGVFGPPPWHPALPARLGDRVLLMKDNYTLRDTLAHEKPLYLPAVHAGVSAEEMWVPLIVAGCVD